MGPNHAMILPRDANPEPDGFFGKDTQIQPMVRWGIVPFGAAS
jgi:hypothetical protein